MIRPTVFRSGGAACLVVAALATLAWAVPVQVRVELPKGTVFLDLNGQGEVRVADRKEPLGSAEQVQDYLRSALPGARNAQNVEGKPLAVLRVREPVADKRVEEVRKLCRDAGFRSGLDENWTKAVFSPAKVPEQPGAVVLFINAKGEFVPQGRRAAFRSLDDVKKYVKEDLPRARAAAQKARGKEARPALVFHAEKVPANIVQTLAELMPFCRDNGLTGPSLDQVQGGTGRAEGRTRLELDP
jgi:hypothetical protein